MMQRLTFGLAAALSLAACVSPAVADQPTIRLFPKGAPGALPGMPPLVVETRPGTPGRTIRNVSDPTIEAYLPDPKIATGTGVVIAPGGGFHMLSYDNEGVEVAKWLNSIGIAAFVLRYRLLPTGDDVAAVLIRRLLDRKEMISAITPLQPLVLADGEQAMRYVRSHAAQYRLKSGRIGFMGFSAGGSVAVRTTLANQPDSRPDFLIAIYPGLLDGTPPVTAKAPPLFDLVAADDPIVRPEAERLQKAWHDAGADTTFVTVATGSHGFGMAKHGTASDGWTATLQTWLDAKGLLRK